MPILPCYFLVWRANLIWFISSRHNRVVYNNCCKGGKVAIPTFRCSPEPLASLATFNGAFPSSSLLYLAWYAFRSLGIFTERFQLTISLLWSSRSNFSSRTGLPSSPPSRPYISTSNLVATSLLAFSLVHDPHRCTIREWWVGSE